MLSRPRSLLALAATVVAVVAAPAPAQAEIGFSDCDTPSSSAVFLPWADTTEYFLAPDGGFENGADGWDLDGAEVVAGNESYDLSGAGESSLALGSGDSATSPAVCVGLEHPVFRYVVRRTSGSSFATLKVEVVLPGGEDITVGYQGGVSSWQPSAITLIGANLLPLITGGYSTEVSFRFTPVSGTWQVDDVYVDPRGSH